MSELNKFFGFKADTTPFPNSQSAPIIETSQIVNTNPVALPESIPLNTLREILHVEKAAWTTPFKTPSLNLEKLLLPANKLLLLPVKANSGFNSSEDLCWGKIVKAGQLVIENLANQGLDCESDELYVLYREGDTKRYGGYKFLNLNEIQAISPQLPIDN